MSAQLITLIILILAIVLFLFDKFPPDAIALGVVVLLGLSGVLTILEALSGFGKPTVVTIIAVFILAQGLKQAGWTDHIASLVLHAGGMAETRLILVVMTVAALLSFFMNNVAVAAVLIPAVISVASQARLSSSRLLMPLAVGILLGGAATLFTTTNLVSNSLLIDSGQKGFGLLDFLPLGLVIIIVGVLYMLFYGRKRLPQNAASDRYAGKGIQNLVDTYQLAERMIQARIVEGSPLVGKSLLDCGIRQDFKLNLVMINRKGLILRLPAPETILSVNDILVMEGRHDLVDWESLKGVLEMLPEQKFSLGILHSDKVVVMEAVLAPRSTLIGQTLKDARFRDKYGVQVLGIWRAGKPIRSELGNRTIQFGDGLLLYGPREKINLLIGDPDLILLHNPEVEFGRARKLSWLALGIFLTTILFSIIFTEQLSLIMLAGSLVMIFTGILSIEQAYRAVEWRTIFLVAGMLSLGTAIIKTGLAGQAVSLLTPIAEQVGPYAAFIVLFVLTLILSQVVHGAVVATIMVPIGIQLAFSTGMSPRALVMGLALATSMSFATPLGHPVNMLIMAPGDYQFKDYVRVGLPLAALLSIVILSLLPIFWPLHP
ncbi:MAG: SLC13 family permease [Anaerolineaceae bacterium]